MGFADPAVTVETFLSPGVMQPDAALLLEAADSLFGRRGWWDTVLDAAMPPGRAACFVLCRIGGKPAAVFPMCREPHGGTLHSLTTP